MQAAARDLFQNTSSVLFAPLNLIQACQLQQIPCFRSSHRVQGRQDTGASLFQPPEAWVWDCEISGGGFRACGKIPRRDPQGSGDPPLADRWEKSWRSKHTVLFDVTLFPLTFNLTHPPNEQREPTTTTQSAHQTDDRHIGPEMGTELKIPTPTLLVCGYTKRSWLSSCLSGNNFSAFYY